MIVIPVMLELAGASANNTLTIKPNTSVTSIISGSNSTAVFDINTGDFSFLTARTPMHGITNDFVNKTRNFTTPDIGADEFRHSLALNLIMFFEGFYNSNSNSRLATQ